MFISRRQLLASTAWSALAGAASARRSFAQAEVSETADDFTDWAWVRDQLVARTERRGARLVTLTA